MLSHRQRAKLVWAGGANSNVEMNYIREATVLTSFSLGLTKGQHKEGKPLTSSGAHVPPFCQPACPSLVGLMALI